MSKPSEEISKYNANSSGKTDSNLANDALHLGGIEAEDYATKKYVQDYYNGKENLLKEYIDSRDTSILQEAKSYTDNIVNNQDFSNFAKIPDIQALDNKLSNKINEFGTTCSNKIKQVVDDVNSNFDDVNKSITNLNNKSNELFQSVSNGKQLIAEAITDKGVNTSANDSFNQMSTNIRKIATTVPGGIPEGYIDTSDATATAGDIVKGKTAYVNGKKIVGQFEAASEVESNPDNPYPVVDEVELIYTPEVGSVVNKLYTTATATLLKTHTHAISGDGNILILYDGTESKFKIYRKSIGQDGSISYVRQYSISGTGNEDNRILSTPDYSFTELKMDTGTVADIKFAPMNNRESESAYLTYVTIAIKDTNTGKIILYTYGVYTGEYIEDGYSKWGKIFTTNRTGEGYCFYRIWKHTTNISNGNFFGMKYSPYYVNYKIGVLGIVHTNGITLFTMSYLYNTEHILIGTATDYGEVTQHSTLPVLVGAGSSTNLSGYGELQFLNSNRLIEATYRYSASGATQALYVLDSNLNYINGHKLLEGNLSTGIPNSLYVFFSSGLYAIQNNKLFGLVVNYSNGNYSLNQIATLNININASYKWDNPNNSDNYVAVDDVFFVSMGNVYSLDTEQKQLDKLVTTTYSKIVDINVDGSMINMQRTDGTYETVYIRYGKTLAGLKYKGQMFYSRIYPNGVLTAKQIDVANGKTFVGYDGIPEAGTMEVIE